LRFEFYLLKLAEGKGVHFGFSYLSNQTFPWRFTAPHPFPLKKKRSGMGGNARAAPFFYKRKEKCVRCPTR
jgi:hypothetical protein